MSTFRAELFFLPLITILFSSTINDVLRVGLEVFPGFHMCDRAVGRSEKPRVPVSYSGQNRPPLVEIGSTDLPKSGGAMAPPALPGATPLSLCVWR